jgi:hypothetical protein
MGLAAILVDDAEATEAVGDLADSLGTSGGIKAHIVQVENVGKQVKIATTQEVLDVAADGCTAGPVTRLAVLVQGQRGRKHGVEGILVILEVQTPQVRGEQALVAGI